MIRSHSGFKSRKGSLHKIQIFAMITFGLTIFGLFIASANQTFATICSPNTAISNSTITQNGSYSFPSGTTSCSGGLIDPNVAIIIGIMTGIAAVCILPFI